MTAVVVLTGDERWAARGWAAAGLLLSLATTLMLVYVSYVHRDLETAMSGKDTGGAPALRMPRIHASWCDFAN